MYNFDNFNDEPKEEVARIKKPKNMIKELKKDLQVMIDRDPFVLDDIKIYKDITGENIDNLTENQLNELIVFCINNQLTRERIQREEN